MILYTHEGCPRCKVIKMKLDKAEIPYECCSDEVKMKDMGLLSVPVLEKENGDLLRFNEILTFIKEEKANAN